MSPAVSSREHAARQPKCTSPVLTESLPRPSFAPCQPLPRERLQEQMWQTQASSEEPLLCVLAQPLVPEQHSLHV